MPPNIDAILRAIGTDYATPVAIVFLFLFYMNRWTNKIERSMNQLSLKLDQLVQYLKYINQGRG